jgi:hypothetical protein
MSHLVMEYVPLKELNPVAWNPRRISDKEFSGLVESIKKFGFVDPVIVNRRNMHICGGHQRVRAADSIGIEKVPVVFVDLSDAEEKALNVTLNSHTVAGKFDNDVLTDLLMEIKNLDESLFAPLNLDQLGMDLNLFTDGELEDIDPQDSSEIKENYNFTIKCKSKEELEDIQASFGVTGSKMSYDKFKVK